MLSGMWANANETSQFTGHSHGKMKIECERIKRKMYTNKLKNKTENKRWDTIDIEYTHTHTPNNRMGLRNEWVSDITIKQNVSFYIIAEHKATLQCSLTHKRERAQTATPNTCSFVSVVKDTRNCNKLHGCDLRIELLLFQLLSSWYVRDALLVCEQTYSYFVCCHHAPNSLAHCVAKRIFKLPCWSPVKMALLMAKGRWKQNQYNNSPCYELQTLC